MNVLYTLDFSFQIGRAGRDGFPSKTLLLFSNRDRNRVQMVVGGTNSDAEVSRELKVLPAFIVISHSFRKQSRSDWMMS